MLRLCSTGRCKRPNPTLHHSRPYAAPVWQIRRCDLSLLIPAALAFSIIIPIILLLYFMRPKRQERVVSSTLLWQQASLDLQASRPWQRLRITPLLLLQLLAAIFIVLVLIRPAIFTNNPLSGNAII